MKSKLSILLSLVLSFSLVTVNTASADYEWVNRNVSWIDFPMYGTGVLYNIINDGNSSSATPCDEGWESCDPENGDTVLVSNGLESCETVSEGVPCLEAAWVRASATDEWIAGTNHGELIGQTGYAWTERPEVGVGDSYISSDFTFDDFNHGGGTHFNIQATTIANLEPNSAAQLLSGQIMVSAVTTDMDVAQGECIFRFGATDQTCWKEVRTPNPYQLKVAIRLPQMPKGWANGRLESPNFQVESELTGALPYRLTFEGSPVLTPNVAKDYWYNDLEDRTAWDALTAVWDVPWIFEGDTEPISAGPAVGPTSIAEFLKAVKIDDSFDTANFMRWVWRVDYQFESQTLYDCTANKLVGFIGSNSMTYASEFPQLNETTYSLDYAVASPHKLPDGEVFEGIYEMRLDVTFANCIWRKALGLKNVEFDADNTTVTVTTPGGATKEALTSVDVKNGMIAFTAKGFTFSKNIIKSKLTKLKKTTIVCVKGKKTKKVTALKPKCPNGWKKKKK